MFYNLSNIIEIIVLIIGLDSNTSKHRIYGGKNDQNISEFQQTNDSVSKFIMATFTTSNFSSIYRLKFFPDLFHIDGAKY